MKGPWTRGLRFGVLQAGSYILFGLLLIAFRSLRTTVEADVKSCILLFTFIPLVISASLAASVALLMMPSLSRRMDGLRAGIAGLISSLLLWTGPAEWLLARVDRLPILRNLGVDGTVSAFTFSTLTLITASTAGMILAWALPPWRSRVQSAA